MMRAPPRWISCVPKGSVIPKRFAPHCTRRRHGGATRWPCARKFAGSPTIPRTATRCAPSASRWRNSRRQLSSRRMVRGEVFRLPAPPRARGHEQRSARYAVVVQADELLGLSTALIAPTSARARAATFRPAIEVRGTQMRVLVEQTTVVDPQRLGKPAGRLDAAEMQAVDEALRLILAL